MASNKIDLIRQALSAAESSIKLAKQLLSEVESEGKKGRPKAKELPGTIGVFDGQQMITEKGEKYPVPENYASKSILVVGDTLKLVEGGREKRFKQIEHVKRHKTAGIIAKKDGKWTAVTPEGSYRLLQPAVDHFEGNVGDEVLVQLPASNLQATWAAVEKVTKKESPAVEETPAQSVKDDGKRPLPQTQVEEKKEKETKPKPKKKEKKTKESKETAQEKELAATKEEKQSNQPTELSAEDELR
jgi:hypothetical protein